MKTQTTRTRKWGVRFKALMDTRTLEFFRKKKYYLDSMAHAIADDL